MLSICLSQRASLIFDVEININGTPCGFWNFSPLSVVFPCALNFPANNAFKSCSACEFPLALNSCQRGGAREHGLPRAYWETFLFFLLAAPPDAYKKVAPRPDRRSADLDTPPLSMNSLLLLALLGCLGKCKCPLILNWPIYLVHSCGLALVGDAMPIRIRRHRLRGPARQCAMVRQVVCGAPEVPGHRRCGS